MSKRRFVVISLCLLAALVGAHAAEPPSKRAQAFVAKLEPCMELLEAKTSSDTYQIIFGNAWQVQLFEIAASDGGGLGSDMCGELDGVHMGGYDMPEGLGWESIPAGARLNETTFTPAWLRRALANAEAALPSKGARKLDIQRVTVSLLPDESQFLVRVFFVEPNAEMQAEAPAAITVDLNSGLQPIERDSRVPDILEPRTATEAPPTLEQASAPSVDPQAAWQSLLRGSPKIAEATIARVIFSNFAANVNYQSGAAKSMRNASYDFLDGQERNFQDGDFEFPAAFKKCALTAKQVDSAIAGIKKNAKFQSLAPRLLHLILECRAERGKAKWNLTAMEPFEYLDVPAQY